MWCGGSIAVDRVDMSYASVLMSALRVLGLVVVVVVFLGLLVLWSLHRQFGSSREDRRRVAILARDRMLDLEVPGVVPIGPLSTYRAAVADRSCLRARRNACTERRRYPRHN